MSDLVRRSAMLDEVVTHQLSGAMLTFRVMVKAGA